MRQEREFLAHRATIQATIGGDGNQKAIQSSFQDLLNAFNPYLEETKGLEKKKMHDRVFREVNRGALAVTPTGPAVGGKNYGAIRRRLNKSPEKDTAKPEPIRETPFDKRRTRHAANPNRNG